MAKSNFSDPQNNDLSSSFPPPKPGDPGKSEAQSDSPRPGVGGQEDNQCTPAGKRAGYGHQYVGPNHAGSAMGGHNMDQRGQYTVKVKRGSSL